KPEEISVSESAVRDIIRYYSREAGVRSVEREVSKICRKVVKMLVVRKGETALRKVSVNARNLDKFLGVRRYTFGLAEKNNQVGQVTGLAWTEVGGELLTIESSVMPGKGKTPKDGPSAGIGICTALVSVFTGIPVRADVAMTGEITLRGEVLPIGGLKEKLLAAHRGGIKTVLIPQENVKDLAEIPDNIKNRLD